MTLKICTKCKDSKELSSFYKKKVSLDGYNTVCIDCAIAYNKELNRTKDGLINQLYYHQTGSSKKRKHASPIYSKEEFRKWVYNQPNFEELYVNWEKSNYSKDTRPSVDRLEVLKGYEFNNIRLVTWKENFDTYIKSVKNGIDNRINKKLYQYDLKYNLINEYHSIAEASRQNKISVSLLSANATGRTKTAADYIWSFIPLAKDSWSRSEVIGLIRVFGSNCTPNNITEEWIENNL